MGVRQIGYATKYVGRMAMRPGTTGTLGERLRGMRLAAGMTQQQLAARANVSRSVIAGIEADEPRTRTLAVLERLAKACGRPVTDLSAAVVSTTALDTAIDEWERLERLRPITRPTKPEIDWLRSLPAALWVDVPPSIDSLASLVELRRRGAQKSPSGE